MEVVGFVVGAGIGEGAGGGPETAWCTWVGVGLSVLLESGEVFFAKFFRGLLFGKFDRNRRGGEGGGEEERGQDGFFYVGHRSPP